MSHTESHPLAGATVILNDTAQDPSRNMVVAGVEYRVEDWWDALGVGSWMTADGNPAALQYAMRAGMSGLPNDNEVVYGKIDGLGHIVHVSELGEPVTPE